MNENEQLETVEITDRDSNTGRFIRGNKASIGRPSKRREIDYNAALKSAVSSDDIIQIAGKVKEQALKGDFKSQQLLFEFLVPKSSQILQLHDKEMMLLATIFSRFRLAGIEPIEIINSLEDQSVRLLSDGKE